MRDIKHYEGLYKLTRDGRIFSIKANRFLNPSPNRNGYLNLYLSKKGIRKMHRVHRLVAETFIPNPCDLPQVNHINGDKSNNHVENLEWCTASKNAQHGRDLGLWPSFKGKNNPMYGKIPHNYINIDINSIVELKEQGWTLKAISKELGCSIDTVRRRLKNL